MASQQHSMVGEDLFKNRIQKVIGEFEKYFFLESLKAKREGNSSKEISFGDFISLPEYYPLIEELQKKSNDLDGLEQIVFENLTEEQKARIGGLFHTPSQNGDSHHYNRQNLQKQANIIDTSIVNSSEYQDFLNVKDSLTESELDILTSRLATLFHSRLSEEERKFVFQGTLKRHLMGVGFVQMRRAGYKEIIDFVKHYPSLFANEGDALFSIFRRYIDEELARTPIAKTKERIIELKKEAREFYGGIR